MAAKAIGFLVVVIAASAAGSLVAASYRARARELTHLRLALHLLETEITYASSALPGALQRVAAGVPSPVRDIFLEAAAVMRSGQGVSAGDAWERAVREVFPLTALEAGDREILLALAGYLGVTDREDQRRHLALAAERLKAREELAQDERKTSERLWRYLGVLGGLALGVVFL